MPGKDSMKLFLLVRHPVLSERIAENVKVRRTGITEDVLKTYITNLQSTIEGIFHPKIFTTSTKPISQTTQGEKRQ